jgi:hypothetical protein
VNPLSASHLFCAFLCASGGCEEAPQSTQPRVGPASAWRVANVIWECGALCLRP